MNDSSQAAQIAQAEEVLGDRLNQLGFAKALFFGRYAQDQLAAYPNLTADQHVNTLIDELRQYCADAINPAEIDVRSEIPQTVIDGLGRLGVLGACLPRSCGGLEMNQTAYCRILEVLGGHCGSTALFVNAHHSIGPRALVLFGSPDQQQRWLPQLATGQWISAFALTETEAGSDAANVQTVAVPRDDGTGYVINGHKRWITNGGIAQVLTVMARTPDAQRSEGRITAFLVTPDMPGFEVVEKRMDKCGVRGTVTSRLAFHDMFVPRENVLGELGQGLKIALTVLDYGRTTFGASCTGSAKICLQRARDHAIGRVQFGQTLGSFEMVKEKLAAMQAVTLAMESCTYQTAALMDSGIGDFMLETAMLKVFSTEMLWRVINDTIQIHGGKAYFRDEPFERMMRDARINMIGEGANDVLRAFTALVGMRDVGLELAAVVGAILKPIGNLKKLGQFAGRRLGALLVAPVVEVTSAELDEDAAQLGLSVAALGNNVQRLLRTHRESIVDRQHHLGRVADAATELYVSACVLNRLDRALRVGQPDKTRLLLEVETGRYYLKTADRRIRQRLRDLWDNDDEQTNRVADSVLSGYTPANS